jgi:hypothetical protein
MDVIPTTVRFVITAAVVATAACSAPAEPTRNPPPLTSTFESPEALARAVLAALERRDLDALRALPLSETEYREHVWPELPVSRPERNVPFDYSWGQMKQRSDGSLQQTFARYAGKRLTLVRARFTGDTTQYGSFSVMRESEIIATDESGRDVILRLYGSAMVKDRRYKMFSYVVDN